MAYVAPTPADLKARFPKFAAVDDAVIQTALDEAARQVDETWLEGDFAMARMLYACHVMTMDGLGAGAEAKGFANGTNDFKVIKSGALTLERGSSSSSSGGGGNPAYDLLMSTSFGRRFAGLLQQNQGGAIVLTGVPDALSHLGRDFPGIPPNWNP